MLAFYHDLRCPCSALTLALVAALAMAPPIRAHERSGEAIYKEQCASCHGGKGEGVDEFYPTPLIGDRSLAELTQYIDESMPEDDPGKCAGEDAAKVAAFVFDAFYSPIAQARNKPVRIELSRLTVRQYKNALADLVGSFRAAGTWDQERGLRGEYFTGRRVGGRRGRQLERVDPTVSFDFGEVSPDPEKLDDPANFSIGWEGSILAPETGEYEFIVRTEHAARLWVNDQELPLIDAWVKSGSDTEHRGTIRLLAGRAYPLKLEFSKAKQGVNDSKKQKAPPPPVKASVALLWKPPHQAVEVIPARFLSPQENPELFVVQAPFPPDDRSVGYERGTSISKEWDQATTEGAIETAGYVADHLTELAGVSDDASDRSERLKDFCRRFVERAFRRPLTDEQRAFFIDRHFEQAPDATNAVKRVVLLSLKSPRFLYRELGDGNDPYDVASRISFGLWDSLPDQTLLDAAKAGEISTREQVTQQAERMLTDLRAQSKLREFFVQWLKLDRMPDIAKDPEQFPGFTPEVISDLRTSLDLLVEEVVASDASDFRQLLTTDALYLNGALAKFYGVDLPQDAPFQKVPLDPEHRAGVLSHPYLMAGFAYTQASSPIHRGVFIARSVLGRTLRPPPEAVAPLAPDLHASLTTRERVSLQTKPESCQSCHAMVNPLGFTLEHFDAVGRFRKEEQGKAIDATGIYRTRKGDTVQFAGVRELAGFLANSEETHTAFVQQLFHHLIKQPVRAFGSQELPNLRQSFVQNQFHIRKLAVQIIADAALRNEPNNAPASGGR
ncbi:MAG TPA: DUF1592 domain-containing protein [Pirellulaceae bacterium]|nr:DUF1592 domain-containing protein [Pirellulaceae bacterium]